MNDRLYVALVVLLSFLAFGAGYVLERSMESAPVNHLPTPPWVSDGIIAHYPFTGNLMNSSQNRFHGREFGKLRFASDRFGQSESACEFDGVTTYYDPEITITNPNVLSVSLWVRVDQRLRGTVVQLLGPNEPRTALVGAYLGFSDQGRKCFIQWNSRKLGDRIEFKIDQKTDQWICLGVTFRSIEAGKLDVKFYVNGEKVSSMETHMFGQLDKSVLVGRHAIEASEFRGVIDDLRFYDRCLSELEVSSLFEYESANR